MIEKIDKELGVVQDPLQQDIIEHPWVDASIQPGNISMGVGWPAKVASPILSLIHI